MSTTPHAGADAGTATGTPPRWRLIGPGLVVAATGVGAADLVATYLAGDDGLPQAYLDQLHSTLSHSHRLRQ